MDIYIFVHPVADAYAAGGDVFQLFIPFQPVDVPEEVIFQHALLHQVFGVYAVVDDVFVTGVVFCVEVGIVAEAQQPAQPAGMDEAGVGRRVGDDVAGIADGCHGSNLRLAVVQNCFIQVLVFQMLACVEGVELFA